MGNKFQTEILRPAITPRCNASSRSRDEQGVSGGVKPPIWGFEAW